MGPWAHFFQHEEIMRNHSVRPSWYVQQTAAFRDWSRVVACHCGFRAHYMDHANPYCPRCGNSLNERRGRWVVTGAEKRYWGLSSREIGYWQLLMDPDVSETDKNAAGVPSNGFYLAFSVDCSVVMCPMLVHVFSKCDERGTLHRVAMMGEKEFPFEALSKDTKFVPIQFSIAEKNAVSDNRALFDLAYSFIEGEKK